MSHLPRENNGLISVAAKLKQFVITGEPGKSSHLHYPASAVIVRGIHLVFAVLMSGEPR